VSASQSPSTEEPAVPVVSGRADSRSEVDPPPVAARLTLHDQPPLEAVDLDQVAVTRVLSVVLGSVVVASVAIVIVGIATGQTKHVALGVLAVAINAALLVLGRRHGWGAGTAVGASTALLAIVVFLTSTGHGLHDVSIVLFYVPIIISSLLLDRRWAAMIVVTVVVCVLGVGLAEITGILQSSTRGLTSYDDIAVISVTLVATSTMVRAVVRAMYEGFSAARSSERSYREIFDGTGEAIFIHDAKDGRVLDVNRTGSAMFEYSREELLGVKLSDLADPGAVDWEEEARARLSEAVEHGRATFEWRARSKSGRLFFVESNLRSTQIGGEGRVLAAVRDVDDRRRLEESLVQAEKLQAVGQLAGGVAHDFNNQLTGIIAGAELLKRKLADDPISVEYADIILQASRRSADLVGNLLAFARKAKRQEVDVDVCAVVEEVVGLLQRSIDRRIAIEVDLPPSPVFVRGDPALLSNALLNLGLNARDAMPGGGLLRFEVEPVSQSLVDDRHDDVEGASRLVCIRVRDTGQGMDEATQQRIFEPFFTTKQSGTGMGLSAVYGTVKSHGGSVAVETSPGEGTTFELLLPVAAESGTERFPSGFPPPSEAPLDLVVLLAEDEPTVATATRAMLEAMGCRVKVAANGREAVNVFRAERDIDLVLLDRMMPVITGDRALLEIRSVDPDIPAILASGYSHTAMDEERPEGAPVVILRKPFVFGELDQAVREALASGKGAS
jgi:two-component system cell cycle sensor histidine kinase/response regulator CckA